MSRRMLAATALALLAARPLAAQQPPDVAPYLIADRNAEVALARSAAPTTISDSAAVMVLTRTGFIPAAQGTNGFTCLVLRSFSGRVGDPDFWNPRTRAPHCFNPQATRSVLVPVLRRAELVLAGVSMSDIAARIRSGYASRVFVLPEPGAMAYMLSPHQHLQDGDPQNWLPHLMFYYDSAVPAAAWGAGGFSAPVIDAGADPDAPVRTLLVPVTQWSDGTAAIPRSTAPQPSGR